jgi:hypothetical protein
MLYLFEQREELNIVYTLYYVKFSLFNQLFMR